MSSASKYSLAESLAGTIDLALTAMKVEHDIQTHQKPSLPQNYRQAARMNNFRWYWLPAMRKQDASLQEKEAYNLVPRRHGMTVLPSKWVFVDEKTDPDIGITTARAKWVVCGNFDQGSWNSHDLYAAVVNSVTVNLLCPSGRSGS